MTHSGPFQPLLFCDSVIPQGLSSKGESRSRAPGAWLRPYHCELSIFGFEDLRLLPNSKHHCPFLPRADAKLETANTDRITREMLPSQQALL